MIMSHCHLYPGGLGEEKRDEFGIPGTPAHLTGFMRSLGFAQAIGLAPHEDPPDPKELARIDGGQDGLEWLLGHPEVGTGADAPIIPAITLNPAEPASRRRLEAAHGRGVRVIKIHPIVERFDPLDQQSGVFFDLAGELGTPVIMHTGGGFWDWTDEHARAEVAWEMGRRHPKLRLLLAHAGCFQGIDGFEAAIRACEECPNLYLETTAVLIEMGAERWATAVKRLGPSRIIYGNDYCWVTADSVRAEIAILRKIAPHDAGAELMLGGNIRRLIG